MSEVILIVDDAPLPPLRLATNDLQEAGHTVLSANNGQEALRLLKDRTDIKFLRTDRDMPLLDGHAFIQQLVETNRLAGLSLLVFKSVYPDQAMVALIADIRKKFSHVSSLVLHFGEERNFWRDFISGMELPALVTKYDWHPQS